MILQLRIDERLIHGQLANGWASFLGAELILAANDPIMQDPIAKRALELVAPAGKRVQIRGVAETIRLLSDPRADKMKILLVVKNPADALSLVKALPINDVNVANYNHQKQSENKVTIHQYCTADAEDLRDFRELAKISKHCFTQIMPTSQKYSFTDLLDKVKTA